MEPRPPTDRLLSRKKPVIKKVPICLDSQLADELGEVDMEIFRLEEEVRTSPENRGRSRDLEDARARREEIRERVEAETIVFTFKSLGRRAFEDLVDSHPATKEQREEARKNGLDDNLQFNVDTFPIALISSCCIDPELDEDTVKQLWNSDEWNPAELNMLFNTALNIHQQRRVVDLGKGSRSTASSSSSSGTASPSVSPTGSS